MIEDVGHHRPQREPPAGRRDTHSPSVQDGSPTSCTRTRTVVLARLLRLERPLTRRFRAEVDDSMPHETWYCAKFRRAEREGTGTTDPRSSARITPSQKISSVTEGARNFARIFPDLKRDGSSVRASTDARQLTNRFTVISAGRPLFLQRSSYYGRHLGTCDSLRNQQTPGRNSDRRLSRSS
jgi:hypothetical protein